MITQIQDTPGNVVAFTATGEITKEDFDQTVMPAVKALVARTNELNYVMQLDTSLTNFTLGAWWKDALLGIQQITKWRRAAIVSDVSAIRTFTDVFSVIVPGEFKGFKPEALEEAIAWCAAK